MPDYSHLGLDQNMRALSSLTNRADRVTNTPGGIIRRAVEEVENKHGHGYFVPASVLSWGDSPRGTEGEYGIFVGSAKVGIGHPSFGGKFQVIGTVPPVGNYAGSETVSYVGIQFGSEFAVFQSFVAGAASVQQFEITAAGSITWGNSGTAFESGTTTLFRKGAGTLASHAVLDTAGYEIGGTAGIGTTINVLVEGGGTKTLTFTGGLLTSVV